MGQGHGTILPKRKVLQPIKFCFPYAGSRARHIKSPVTQNKYLYANANPVNFIDENGDFALPVIIAVAVGGGAAFGFGATVLADVINGDTSIPRETYAGNTVGGAVSGALVLEGPMLAGAAGGLASEVLEQALMGKGFNAMDIIGETFVGGLTGFFVGKLAPRPPGRTPTKLITILFGKIGRNEIWKSNFYELLLGLPESILQRLTAQPIKINGLNSCHG